MIDDGKKVLVVRTTPYNEDINSYNVQSIGIAKAICRLGYDCDYLSADSKRTDTIEIYEHNGKHVRVIFSKRIRVLRTGICFGALKPTFLEQYDYIICREYNQLMTHLIAKGHHNVSMYSGAYWNMFMIPVVSSVYDALYTRKLNDELKCKFVKSQLAKEFLEKKGYTDLIDVGVGLDTTRFEGVECSEPTKELADYMRENRCLLYIGTLDANKNIPFIIDVFKKVLEKEPDLKLILIGKSKQSLKNKLKGKSNESYYEELIQTVPEAVRQNIKHVNRVENPQLQYIYPLARAFILPSIHEIFGMVMLEAMYFGTPVITSRNGGSSTLIKDDSYGQMIREYDSNKWANGVLRFLEDEEYTKNVIENCKALIREQYTWETITAKMLSFINS